MNPEVSSWNSDPREFVRDIQMAAEHAALKFQVSCHRFGLL
jgi:hypothetical protein